MLENIEECGDCYFVDFPVELREHLFLTGHKGPGPFQGLMRGFFESGGIWLGWLGGPTEWDTTVGSKTISEGPIQQVNIRDEGDGPWVQGDTGPSRKHYADFVIPDPRSTSQPWRNFHIYSCKVRTFPLIGRVVKCSWKGNDLGLGILNRLSDDGPVNSLLMKSKVVHIHVTREAWIITVQVIIHESGRLNEEQLVRFTSPGPQLACYQAIARHLLDTPIPPRK